MIFLDSGSGLVPLGVYDAEGLGLPVDLSELLYAPQTQLVGDTYTPPPRPPYEIDFAPGTLYWPAGASRFAVGQYVVTEREIQTLWPTFSLFSSQPVTLQLGGTAQGTGQEPVTFESLYPLHILPLDVNRSTVVPATQAQALYLLVLVDSRYFFQTEPPTWTVIDGTTTWDDLDDQLSTFFDGAVAIDAVPAAYLKPSKALAPPEFASTGVVAWAGPLIDAIAEASGRRFVNLRDGNYALQSWSTAGAANEASLSYNEEFLWRGGLLSTDPADEEGDGLFVVPLSITAVYPVDSGGSEGSPIEVTRTYDQLKTAAGYGTGDVPSAEGNLRVGFGLWGDGSNTAALTAHAVQWETDWYAWLRGPMLQVYSGAVLYDPNGYADSILWCVRPGEVWTRVARGLLNPRPNAPVGGYSGVPPLGPIFPDGATFLGPVYFIGSTVDFIDEIVTFDNTVSYYTNGSVTSYDSSTTVNVAGVGVYTGPTYYPLYDYSGSPFSADVTNWTIPAGNARIRIGSTVEYVFINSIDPGADPSGRLIYLYNVDQYTILVVNESVVEADPGKRILTTDGNFYAIAPHDCVCLAYDLTSLRWRVSENSHKRLSKYHAYPEWSGNQSNVNLLPEVELHAVSADGPITWDGVSLGLYTLRHRVVNNGDEAITLLHNTGSAVGNRFTLPGATSYRFVPSQEILIEYDDAAEGGDGAWHVVGLLPNDPAAVTVDAVTGVCLTPYSIRQGATDATATVSGAWGDLTGAGVIVAVPEAATYIVWGFYDVNGDGTAAVVFDPTGAADAIDTYEGGLEVDGVLQTPVATFAPAHPLARATVAQVWEVPLTAASHTLQLRGRRAAGTGSAVFEAVNTALEVLLLAPLTVEKRPVRIPGGTVGTASCATNPEDCCDTDPPVVATDCCPDDLWPQTLYMHFSGGTGDCDCLDGGTLTMTWDGSAWVGSDTLCVVPVEATITCAVDEQFYLVGTMGGLAITGGPADTLDCVTYAMTWAGVSLANAGCTGTIDVTVNTTP